MPLTEETEGMNDFAKFFFCAAGFLGFSLFFTVALFLHGEASQALFYGASGCLLFSLSGRFLLGFALKGALDQSLRGSVPQKAEGSLEQKTSLLEQEKLTAERMTESVANPKKSIVEAKV